MSALPVLASQLPPWIPLVVQGILVIVSAAFAVGAYLLKKKIEERDTEHKEMRSQLQELLRLVPVLESLQGDISEEGTERKHINEQQWSKINEATKSISDLDSTLSKTQTKCRDTFITQQEWTRMERLRERQDEMLGQQIRRLEQSVDRVIVMLQTQMRINGRK
jgi:hypothetical protein